MSTADQRQQRCKESGVSGRYGDVDVPESAMPYYDGGSVPADRSIAVLIERLQLNGPGNRRLRRIELFTLRRFFETRGAPHADLRARLRSVLETVDTEVSGEADWDVSVRTEIAALERAAGVSV